mmetsp:Transcript_13109/g.20353  ORF Transcript_13109/g.20353 Transcript_13109/m.20353 type:complete len:298 (+) Transcript_13109:380-1273(+)|eukprot:CAMPEP_0170511784 /NCGR_PEP_ID=MMETSP0208-20121228/66490_1 /TAXON_ID=197538 /ORGANISM="Strombidium inclinatum, Strain S3" /LENGTH=297 /DNA_ID=CAMNT_0010795351 /DNA_START=2415 /DNA_END=3308 /DNA_ORIENTATION=-
MNYFYATHDNNITDNVKYLELHAGPEYQFENKMAPLNAVLMTVLVFGMAFPLLYLVALFAIAVQYITERYTLAMMYRLPQKYSLSLTLQNAQLLAFAPIISSFVGFWMLGNRQLFGHSVSPLGTKNDIPQSGHTLGSEADSLVSGKLSDLESIFLIAFILTVFAFAVYSVTHTYELLFKEPVVEGRESPVKGMSLPDYMNALKEQDLEEMMEEEFTYVNEFGVNNISNEHVLKGEQILTAKMQSATLEQDRVTLFGEPYYQCFKVFDNWLRFNSTNNKEEKNIKLLLNLPMIPERYH